jgi:hypothetical protein
MGVSIIHIASPRGQYSKGVSPELADWDEMKLLRCLAVIIILAISIMPIAVLAGTSVNVTITATPMFTAGITSFTITYISETQIDLDWTVDASVDQVMIRAKYGEYPANIPDEDTAPTDGYLVYYGNGLAASDTSMDFDSNLGTLYYKAWAQKADGHWYVATSTGFKESEVVALILLFGFGLVISGYAITKKNVVIAIIASAIWLATIYYTRQNPIGSMVTGDNADTAILLALIGLLTLVPIISFRLSKREERQEMKEDDYKERVAPKKKVSSGGIRESTSDYYDRLHQATHPKK